MENHEEIFDELPDAVADFLCNAKELADVEMDSGRDATNLVPQSLKETIDNLPQKAELQDRAASIGDLAMKLDQYLVEIHAMQRAPDQQGAPEQHHARPGPAPEEPSPKRARHALQEIANGGIPYPRHFQPEVPPSGFTWQPQGHDLFRHLNASSVYDRPFGIGSADAAPGTSSLPPGFMTQWPFGFLNPNNNR